MTIDTSKISEQLKSLLSYSIILPFWYISIYIFNIELYNSNDLILLTSICICLTLISSILCSIMAFILIDKGTILTMDNTLLSIIIQISTISLFIFLSYIYSLLFGKIFLLISFVFVYYLVLSILIYVLHLITSSKYIKDNK